MTEQSAQLLDVVVHGHLDRLAAGSSPLDGQDDLAEVGPATTLVETPRHGIARRHTELGPLVANSDQRLGGSHQFGADATPASCREHRELAELLPVHERHAE